ncbi:hypothetical protein AB0K35_27685 [Micromonospora sp. NPDC053740]|uniref:hypothetical protein n=1 Tax=Micromonospora sp. NPDC053740 TaxID=3155173 RepID=UPI003435A720
MTRTEDEIRRDERRKVAEEIARAIEVAEGRRCPVCCGPCFALKTLLDAGQLDDIVRAYGSEGWDWWDADTGQVDRGLLARAWRMTECHAERTVGEA